MFRRNQLRARRGDNACNDGSTVMRMQGGAGAFLDRTASGAQRGANATPPGMGVASPAAQQTVVARHVLQAVPLR